MNTYKLMELFLHSQTEFIEKLSKQTGETFLNPSDLEPHIPFTKQDLLDHIRKNKLEKKLLGYDAPAQFEKNIIRSEGVADGLYMVPAGDVFKVYWQERGVGLDEKSYLSEADALKAVREDLNPPQEHLESEIVRYVDRSCALFNLN